MNFFFDNYVGKINPKIGRGKAPKFAHKSWNKHADIMNHEDNTSNRASIKYKRWFGLEN